MVDIKNNGDGICSMWVRKKIEITGGELLRGVFSCCLPANREQLLNEIEQTFAPGQTFVCLSIRSGFDLFLRTMNWPAGSEIVMSGLTIPDMPRIVRRNQLVPVGVDVDVDTLAPKLDALRASINPQTKAIVVAHLFGGRVEMDAIVALAQEHGLMLVEDCAQAYVGNHYRGHSGTDVSMFSFGPIKTNTALGGGVFVVRKKSLLQRLNESHEQWRVNGRWSFAKRIMKYAGVRFISTRLIAGTIARTARLLGSDHDGLATKMARGFPGPRFFDKIRQQPSTPLLGLLAKKLQTFDPEFIARRIKRGKNSTECLRSRVDVLGSQMSEPTFWVFPILVNDRTALVKKLWALGFDATTRSSLVPINRVLDDSGNYSESDLASDPQLLNSHFIFQNLVFLPFDVSIPEDKLTIMARAILDAGATRPARPISSLPELKTLADGEHSLC